MLVQEAFAAEDARFEVREQLAGLIGRPNLEQKECLAPEVTRHNIAVGAGARLMLAQAGLSENVCATAAAMGGLHDYGKYHPWMVRLSQPHTVFTPVTRALFSRCHARAGADAIRGLPGANDNPTLKYAAFAAENHHTRLPFPTEAESTQPLGLAFGLTHVVQVCDVLHALTSRRPYVEIREGVMTADRVREKVLANRPDELFIDGVLIHVHDFVNNALELQRESVAA